MSFDNSSIELMSFPDGATDDNRPVTLEEPDSCADSLLLSWTPRQKQPRRLRRGWTRRIRRANIKPDGGATFPIDRGLGVFPTGAVLLARAVQGLITPLSDAL